MTSRKALTRWSAAAPRPPHLPPYPTHWTGASACHATHPHCSRHIHPPRHTHHRSPPPATHPSLWHTHPSPLRTISRASLRDPSLQIALPAAPIFFFFASMVSTSELLHRCPHSTGRFAIVSAVLSYGCAPAFFNCVACFVVLYLLQARFSLVSFLSSIVKRCTRLKK